MDRELERRLDARQCVSDQGCLSRADRKTVADKSKWCKATSVSSNCILQVGNKGDNRKLKKDKAYDSVFFN